MGNIIIVCLCVAIMTLFSGGTVLAALFVAVMAYLWFTK